MFSALAGEQLWVERITELGDPVRDDAGFYISGNDWVLDNTVIDISGVNNMKVGDYTVRAESPFKEYSYKIYVRDTTPPELELGSGKDTVLSTGEEYDLEILGASASDLSGMAFIRYYHDGREIDKLKFDKASRPEITVRATDGNMNMTEKTVKLVVDTPPRFYGLHDQYIMTGSSLSDLDPVFACDDVDGGITSDIKRDLSGLNLANAGDYRISYEVKDSYGLTAEAQSTVHVVSSAQTVDKHRDDCRISSSDLSYAVEEGFFKSGPFSEPDRDRVIEECRASLINLMVREADGAVSSGSAFVYSVASDYVYMVSVYHVTSELEREPVTITFYDGSSPRAPIKSIRLRAGNEAALFRVPVRSVPYHVLVRLKEVAVDEDIYDYVKAGTPLIEYSSMWRGGERPEIIKDVKVISFRLSDIQKKYVDGDSYFTVTRESESGMSGTAVFDYRGVLAGICSKTILP
ncbi:MAG: hypothetical protein IJT24_01105, partial [Lachnospiraceae bacterium]|nr:hypothetical protein [Lachnospiraceae bacterium]